MTTKPYKIEDPAPLTACEPAVAYERAGAETPSSDGWNPNVPFHGTQEEWWEHFHQIEEGPFYTLEEADEEFEVWKKELLASRF